VNVAELARVVIDAVKEGYDNLQFSRALESVWTLLSAVDKLIVDNAPWKLVKSS
jgi:methionyl-tRNA synthetase